MRAVLVVVIVILMAWTVITVLVERESAYVTESLAAGHGAGRALVLYHPSRDAHFSDDLSLAVGRGLAAGGFAVDRATTTSATPAHPAGYSVIAVVSNTYNWAPDRPTLRYLHRADFAGMLVVGLIGGGGSTGRSARLLDAALRGTGATTLGTHAFWIWRPNDERRQHEPNRQVALERAQQLGLSTADAGMRASSAHAPR